MPEWNSAQYLKFQRERTQPALDLAARLRSLHPRKIIDIGCGPGNSTRVLLEQFPDAEILGVDSSSDMIETARRDCPGASFSLCDVGNDCASLGSGFDLVFSNACLQWIPDHPKLLPELMELLAPGGVLGVQVPMNYEEPIHHIIQEVSSSENWAPKFDHPRIFYTLTPGGYYDLLGTLSTDVMIWQTTYFHVMESHQAIVEWYRGTGLRPYLQLLDEADQQEFEAEIYQHLCDAYPLQKDGKILFRFPRLFFTAVKNKIVF